jgi:uncharacterized protein (DUF2235 family)
MAPAPIARGGVRCNHGFRNPWGAAGMAKRIVLMSDGTGNAASSIWRTNVWRTFQAIDLTSSDQVACYDDGVGTSTFKPLAILGGAFGYGLKRNVLHLYKFVCRNYESDSAIYAFGFSRGAFTIRVLTGLIANQGLVPFTTEDDLQGQAAAAYREFRRQRYASRAGALLRPLRDIIELTKRILFSRRAYDSTKNNRAVGIRFLGLWDTVAAYGLPVDEWTSGINQYLWPLELPDRKLWSKVERAYHALSIDDERTTFHPVLWDESVQHPGQIVQQVWFAGVHANVGGGYPDDSLAGVPLFWIMKRAEEAGLVFKVSPKQPDSVLVTESSRDKDGRLYDSRAGLGGYYRYGPRDIAALSNDEEHGVSVKTVNVHESVFGRMKSRATAYAAIGLPAQYSIFHDDGTVAPQGGPSDMPVNAGVRHQQQQQVWNVVWWRRVFYFLTLAATLHLVLFPLFHPIDTSGAYTTRLRFIPELLGVASEFLPGFVKVYWLNYYASNPATFAVSVLVLAALIGISGRLATTVRDRMLTTWRGAPLEQTALGTLLDSVQPLRTSVPYRTSFAWVKYRIAPAIFAFLTLYVVVAFASHVIFYFKDAAGFTCIGSTELKRLAPANRSQKLVFPSDRECFATGIELTAGVRYVIQVTNPQGWADSTVPSDLGGYGISSLPTFRQRLTTLIATPFRRVLLRPWFRIIARIGVTGTDEYFLDPDVRPSTKLEVPFVAHRSGEMFLYVNDAVLPIFSDVFYSNNKGTAEVVVIQRDRPR